MRPLSSLLPFLPLIPAYTPLSPALLKSLPAPAASDFDPSTGALLAPLLIPRVPGTPGQVTAQNHLASFFRAHLPQWELLWQNSTGTTPATGDRQIPFANLIARRLPPGTKREALGEVGMLTLVAHYDSKMQPKGFVGATDSAAPCAVLMDVARAVEGVLGRVWKGGESQGVQVLLLDGEEAFVSWTETDSLYGARALAAEWEATPYPAMSTFANPLRQISLFVLLDLLGGPHPEVPSYFQSTHWAYKRMAALEGRLRQEGLLESAPGAKPFLSEPAKASADFSGAGFVGDDHVPFMARGAPVLHIIPSPFPPVWHTMADDGAHLDLPTVRDWSRIVTAFALEFLDVETAPEAKGG